MGYEEYNELVRFYEKRSEDKIKYIIRSDFKDLFRPAWDSWREDEAVKAVNKLKKQATLARAAKKARCRKARIKAIEKLTNQSVLINLAKFDRDPKIRRAAIEKVNDQKALADIVRNDPGKDVCVKAFIRLKLLVNDDADNLLNDSARSDLILNLIQDECFAYLDL